MRRGASLALLPALLPALGSPANGMEGIIPKARKPRGPKNRTQENARRARQMARRGVK